MKFNIGDKVVPFNKSVFTDWEVWMNKTHPIVKFFLKNKYLIVVGFESDRKCYVLGDGLNGSGGDYFLDKDIKRYIENKQMELF